jgi:signal transduction histidine kinase
MTSITSVDYPSLDKISKEAQRALKERPSLSIRFRLGLSFALWVILTLCIIVFSIILVSQIRKKLHFTEGAGNYMFEIQQARRFEKNYFLYGTNLIDAMSHIQVAHAILDMENENMISVIGETNFKTMANHLSQYQRLLPKLESMDRKNKVKLDAIETELREHGSIMVTAAQEIVNKERNAIHSLLITSQRIPFVFIGLLFIFIIYLTLFVTRQILAPLNRMMSATQRIADGDLTPITPKRKYHDEFSKLAIAMNHMMDQLITRQKLLLNAHKMQAIGTLTAGVAHELNNPINNIILTASMLLEDYNDLPEAEQIDMVKDLVSQSERAQKIVKNLLDFARESEIDIKPLDIESLIENTLRLAANQIKIAKVKIKGELAENLPPIFGDYQQLTQVFLNIILNALDAMRSGGSLTISVTQTQQRDFVSIEFIDTGTGIPAQHLDNIFDPFFTTKPKAKGTGLGLSVSLGIIRQHGGDIRVRSNVGEGTTFTVLLPISKIPAKMKEL